MPEITVLMPVRNGEKYIKNAIDSVLNQTLTDFEFLIIDDGSKDKTGEIADAYQKQYPDLVKVIHKENGGHGSGVNAGLACARGVYFKVVDSDDWLDADALATMLQLLRGFEERDLRVDLFISNYVYEKVHEGTHTTISYRMALPRKKVFTWGDIGRFRPDQNLLMHSLCYRTDVLRAHELPMPPHTFYVDNIYAYVPLPNCETLYYADIDLYRYFIGREGQSVNEEIMVGRLDQQFRITRIMMQAYHLYEDVPQEKLRSYMMGYFTMMMAICSVFTKLSDKPGIEDELAALWAELKAYDEKMYRKARRGVIGIGTNLPGKLGEKTTIGMYHLASKIFKFN